jgi:hypothetical protein
MVAMVGRTSLAMVHLVGMSEATEGIAAVTEGQSGRRSHEAQGRE